MAKLIRPNFNAGQFAANCMWEEYKADAYHGGSVACRGSLCVCFFWWDVFSLARLFHAIPRSCRRRF